MAAGDHSVLLSSLVMEVPRDRMGEGATGKPGLAPAGPCMTARWLHGVRPQPRVPQLDWVRGRMQDVLAFTEDGANVVCPVCSRTVSAEEALRTDKTLFMCSACGGVAFLSADGRAAVRITDLTKYTSRTKAKVAWTAAMGAPLLNFAGLLHPFCGPEDVVPEGRVACGDTVVFALADGTTRDTPPCSLWISKRW